MDRSVRVFLEPSGHRFTNLGDRIMFEVAIARLRSHWPDASITVHTLDPATLREIDPNAIPLEPWGARAWSALGNRTLARAALLVKRHPMHLLDDYLDAARTADLVIVSGAGSLNDSFRSNARAVLETLQLANDSGAVTALMGQGLGPMRDSTLRRRAASVLPRVDFIALRERIASVPLLASLGVPADRIRVTGDDAIAAAYAARPRALGSAIGWHVRVADYSHVSDDLASRIGRIVRETAPVVAIPTATHDADVLGRTIATPAELLDEIARCRIVVAGGYHAAALALAMGIPAVTIAASEYYVDKFRGLAGQFGSACRVVVASDRDFEVQLRRAIDEAWTTADATRAELLDAAARQIALGEDAYRQVVALVETRRIARNRS